MSEYIIVSVVRTTRGSRHLTVIGPYGTLESAKNERKRLHMFGAEVVPYHEMYYKRLFEILEGVEE